MVGWNVVAMQLVAKRVLYEISNIVYFYFCNHITINEYDEHVECLYECMLLPLCMINNYVSMYVLLQCILFQYFMNAHVHGAGCPDG